MEILADKETPQYEKGTPMHLAYLRDNFPKVEGEEIPKDVPFMEYSKYILCNMHCEVYQKPESEWTDQDYKVAHSRERRLSAANAIQQFDSKEPLTNRQQRIIELVRNGTDFDVSDEEMDILIENPTNMITTFYRECEQEYLKAHPEETRLEYNKSTDSERKAYFRRIEDFIGVKDCKGKIVDGRYYGEPIPEDVPFTEYARYIYRNHRYAYESKTKVDDETQILKYDLKGFDEIEFEANWKRQLAAIVIMNWEKSDLTEWQQKVIEDVRTGAELDDSTDDSDYVKLLNLAK
jgi:hypothetical protein